MLNGRGKPTQKKVSKDKSFRGKELKSRSWKKTTHVFPLAPSTESRTKNKSPKDEKESDRGVTGL